MIRIDFGDQKNGVVEVGIISQLSDIMHQLSQSTATKCIRRRAKIKPSHRHQIYPTLSQAVWKYVCIEEKDHHQVDYKEVTCQILENNINNF